jgi:hypothetical protein
MNPPAMVAMIGDRVVEDDRYKFRADLPGNVSERVEDFGVKGAALTWRLYTSSSPESQSNNSYNASVKIFDTDTTDVRQLFTAGENVIPVPSSFRCSPGRTARSAPRSCRR